MAGKDEIARALAGSNLQLAKRVIEDLVATIEEKDSEITFLEN